MDAMDIVMTNLKAPSIYLYAIIHCYMFRILFLHAIGSPGGAW